MPLNMILAQLAATAIHVYTLLFILRAILSWVRPDLRHPVVTVLVRLTEPVLRPIRRMLGPQGQIDLSPALAIAGLILLDWLIQLVLRAS